MPYHKREGHWYSELGIDYKDAIDRQIEELLRMEADKLEDAIRSLETEQRERLLFRSLEQLQSMHFDGFLYTNLLDEFKRGASGAEVIAKARDWGMWSATRVEEGDSGFPRSEAETERENWLQTAWRTVAGWLFGGLATVLHRTLQLVTRLVIPLLRYVGNASFSGISVNAALPPSVSFNFDLSAPVPLEQFMQMAQRATRYLPY